MKLTYLASSSIPSEGADAVHVMKMCNALVKQGVEVTLIARESANKNDPFEYYGIKSNSFKIIRVHRPNIRILGGFIYGINTRRAYRKLSTKQNVVYARSIHALSYLKLSNEVFFFESHWKPQNWLYRRWEKKFMQNPLLAGYIYISQGLKNIYEKEFSISTASKQKHIVLHDACDDPLIKTLYSPKEKLKIGYVGSFFSGYGYGLVAELSKKIPQHDFHIVGGKEPKLTVQKQKYQNENLTFHGHKPHSQLKALYKEFDILLAPYQKTVPHIHWISPMKLFEYMSYQKPIIISDFPVIREIVNENNATLVQSDNMEEWQAAITTFEDASLRQTKGQRAYRVFKTRYTWSTRAKEIIRIAQKHIIE